MQNKLAFIFPQALDSFVRSFVDDERHIVHILEEIRKIREVSEHCPVPTKKTFGTKQAFTLDVNYGRHYHRLVFDLVWVEGQKCYVLKAIAYMHTYGKALRWEPMGSISRAELEDKYVLVEREAALFEENETTMFQYHESWYGLTSNQSYVLSGVLPDELQCTEHLPAVIVGGPGSGKGFLMALMLQKEALKHQYLGHGPSKLLYLAPNQALCDKMDASFTVWARNNLVGKDKLPVYAAFLTYDQFYAWYIAFNGLSNHVLNDAGMLSKIERALKSKKLWLQAEDVLAELKINAHLLNKDLEHHSAPKDSCYYNSGINQSIYSGESKLLVYEVLIPILQQLEENKMFYPGVSRIAAVKGYQFDFTAVDEAQNATIQNQLTALAFTKKGRVVFCGDNYQSSLRISSLPMIASTLADANLKVTCWTLKETQRLSRENARIINELALLYNHLNKGVLAQSYTSICSGESETATQSDDVVCDGTVLVPESEGHLLEAMGRDAHAAVFVLDKKDIPAAQKLTGSRSVFWVGNIIGLEYSMAAVFISCQTLLTFKGLSQEMKKRGIEPGLALEEYVNRSPEKGVLNGPFLQQITDFIVALSRSSGKNFVYFERSGLGKNEYHLKTLLDWLDALFDKNKFIDKKEALHIEVETSTDEEWLSRIICFIEASAFLQAQENLTKHFNLSEKEAELYVALLKKNDGRIPKSKAALDKWLASMRVVEETRQEVPRQEVSRQEVPRQEEALTRYNIDQSNQENATTMKPAGNLNETPIEKKLSPKMVQFLSEALLYIDNSNNIKTILEHKLSSKLLFADEMPNGQCLFVNLFLLNRLPIFLGHVKTLNQSKEIREKWATLVSQGYTLAKDRKNHLLQLSFVIVKNKYPQLVPAQVKIDPEAVKKKIGQAFAPSDANDLKKHYANVLQALIDSNMLNRGNISDQYCVEGEDARGVSALHVLVCNIEKNEDLVKQYATEISKHLSDSITINGCYQGYNLLNLLMETRLGRLFILNNLKLFGKNINAVTLFNATWKTQLLHFCETLSDALMDECALFVALIQDDPEVLFEPVVDDVPNKGETPFFHLCAHQQAVKIIALEPTFLSVLIQDDPEVLFLPVTGDGPNKGKTPFFNLCSHAAGIALIVQEWALFRTLIQDDPDVLFEPVIGNGKDQGKTPLLYLCARPAGIALLVQEWDFFRELIKKNPGVLFKPLIGNSKDKGKTPFFYLCGHREGMALLAQAWDFFGELIKKNPGVLFEQVTGDGSNKGLTPFLYLCGYSEGIALLAQEWDFFRELIKKNPDVLFEQVTGEGFNKGLTPFFYLCIYPEGIALLVQAWDFFRELIQNKPGLLFERVTGEVEEKNKTPFFNLCAHPEGVGLIVQEWALFRTLIKDDSDVLFEPVAGEGRNKGETPFLYLCASPEGISLISDEWDFFKGLIEKNPAALFTRVTGNRKRDDEGLTPFLYLCAHSKGIALLAREWDFFSELIKKNSAALFSAVVGEGEDQGHSPFLYLCIDQEGIALLTRAWDFFRELIQKNAGALFAPITGEGVVKGQTALLNLCARKEGIALLAREWSFFRELIQKTPDALFMPITGEGEDQGKTPIFNLCSYREGFLLLVREWDFFKKLIEKNPRGLFAPLTGKGERQGQTAFLHLCLQQAGIALLTRDWDFFSELIKKNPGALFAQITGEGKNQGETPFFYLCQQQEGIALLVEKWDFFRGTIQDNPDAFFASMMVNGSNKGAISLCAQQEGLALLDNGLEFIAWYIKQHAVLSRDPTASSVLSNLTFFTGPQGKPISVDKREPSAEVTGEMKQI